MEAAHILGSAASIALMVYLADRNRRQGWEKPPRRRLALGELLTYL